MAIEEDLSLNIEDALAAIDRMAEGLQNALIAFFAAFDDAVQQLGQAAIPLNFEAEIEGGVQGAFQETQDVSIEADQGNATGAASAIESDLSDIQGEATLSVDGEDVGLGAAVQDGLDPGDPSEVVFPVSADASNAETEVSGLSEKVEEGANFPVEVDGAESVETIDSLLENITASLGALSQGADGAASSLDGVADSAEGAANAAKRIAEEKAKAAEEAEKLKETTEQIGAAAVFALKGVGSVLGAAFGVATGLFTEAVKAEGALVGFNQQLGDLASEISRVNVNGLNIDLAQLAQNLGSDDEAVLGVAQRFALLGQTAGATNDEISQASSNLFGVAGAIRSVNPNLGELDTIANGLTTAFQQGGRAAARFGLNLSQQEIRLRASIMTGKDQNATFSRFELAAAGASLAAEQFGDSIKTNIELASQNPIIALSRLRQVFGDALEELGKPLIVPFLEIIESVIPIALDFIEILRDIAVSALPVVQEALNLVIPFVGMLASSISDLASEAEPVFSSLAEWIAEFKNVFETLGPVVLDVVAVVGDSLIGVLKILTAALTNLSPEFVTFSTVAIGASFALKTLIPLLIANPWIAAAAGVVFLAGALTQLATGGRDAAEPFDGLVDSILSSITAVERISPAIKEFTSSLEDYLRLEQILEDRVLVKALAESGISAEQFAELIAGGTEGLREFVGLLIATDKQLITLGDSGLPVTKENLDSLTDSQLRSITTNQSLHDVLFDSDNAIQVLINGYNDLANSTNASAEAVFNRAAQEAELTPQLIEVIKNNNLLSEGTVDYAAALAELETRVERNIAVQEQQAVVSGDAAEKNRQFAEGVSEIAAKIATGEITVENFADAVGVAGLSVEQAEEIVKSLSDEMTAFVDNAVSRVPTVAEAFSDLGPENTAQSLIDSFNTQIEATNTWNAEMTRLRREGQTDILKVVAELGPEQGLLLLQQYQGQEDNLANHLRNMAAAEQAALQATREVAVLNWLQIRGITGDAAEAVVRELEGKLTLADATEASITEAIQNVQEKSPELAGAFGEVGANAADALTVGSVEELNAKAGELNTAIEAVWSGAGGVAETASAIAAQAGVDKFNSLVSTGFLDASTVSSILIRTSTFFSTAGLGVGSAFGDSIRMGFLMQVPSITNTIINALETSSRTAFTAAKRAGWEIGKQLIDGLVDHIRIVGAFGTVTAEIRALLDIAYFNNAPYANIVGSRIGASMVDGLVNAIRSGSSSVSSVARNIIANAEAAAKAEAESDSPSKVWERLGRDLVSGLSRGLSNSSRLAEGAASGVIAKTNAQGVGASGTSISISVPVTVSPGMRGEDGRLIGSEVGRAVGAEIMSRLRMEARVS